MKPRKLRRGLAPAPALALRAVEARTRPGTSAGVRPGTDQGL